MLRLIVIILLGLPLMACASNTRTNLKIHQINSLASVQNDTGEFSGLEALANPVEGQAKQRVNLLYLHGIGWTEDRNAEQLGSDFLGGIAKAYNLDAEDGMVLTLCGEAPVTELDKSKKHIFINRDEPRFFQSALPGSQLKLDRLVCMDKQTLNIDDSLEFVLYRVFWDNIFWDDIQFAHVGQDDNRGTSTDFASMRRKHNRTLKDELVNYGFSDAVMYLGPAGQEIRQAIRGAMCSAALDASGFEFDRQGEVISFRAACDRASFSLTDVSKFGFVTESLGSKIMFDVMREALTDDVQTVHDDMIRGSETFMLANQLALLSISNLSDEPQKPAKGLSDDNRPRIVAMSEINDLLSYEIVPFYEQLWKRTIRPENDSLQEFTDYKRRQLIRRLGFDIVDVRLEFADKIIPFVNSFVDPDQAHTGHSGEPGVVLFMLCGAKSGEINREDCRAADREKR